MAAAAEKQGSKVAEPAQLIEEYLAGSRVRYRPLIGQVHGGDGRNFAEFELWKT